jgi:hypothetical protein
MEGQSNKIEQTEDRISELKDEMVIKGKTKELLVFFLFFFFKGKVLHLFILTFFIQISGL